MRFPFDRQSAIMLGIALVAGMLAMWGARQHIQGRIQQIEARAKVPTVQRIVAARDLPAGVRLRPEHLAVRSFPAEVTSSDSLSPEGLAAIDGRLLRAPLRAGDVLLPIHAASEKGAPFSSRLGEGRRAITMPIDAINSASGLLEPGDLIDLYVSFDYQRRRITAPLLQGVLVLATGTSTEGGAGHEGQGYSTVTLDTAPEDAIKLVAARQSGSLTALLRRSDDGTPTQRASRGDLASLIGVSQGTPISQPPRRAPVIYGDRPVRRLAGLRPNSDVAPTTGMFDLPDVPPLVSAWLAAQESMQGTELGEEITDAGLTDD
ncbi:MAG TPA: Flp pilus assembly protein CpaB [Pusillimonas sp.]|uniref:Flp pilus assembly protein CpaB n=1 Tax=unclassified Pusillimonas TaxID=2640016 RepID=UPI002630AF47|nr:MULTISPECIES: Flp pilus assembly protein CpaB [unclassified Pusillimonas]HLU19410.1 Flp pilus assembly protein CpaB [Pusillimonas sp.]